MAFLTKYYLVGCHVMVQIYPVTVLGGEQYVRALKSPFHHIPMVASQGITMGLYSIS